MTGHVRSHPSIRRCHIPDPKDENLFSCPCFEQIFVQVSYVSKADKLKAKIMNPDQVHNVTFDEAVSVLERAGFVKHQGKGSHVGYHHPDGNKITLPCHGSKIKPVYVKQIRELIQP